MKNYAAFDLETTELLPQNEKDWESRKTFGVACAALARENQGDPITWRGFPQMTKSEVQALVHRLVQATNEGCKIITWNGCAFDFRVLAKESGMTEACAHLAANHIDLMLMFTFKQGHFLGLDKALKGAGLTGKRRQVMLSDGQVLNNMDGLMAPKLWAKGEYDAVLIYLLDDVVQPLKLARTIEETGKIQWHSGRGALRFARFDRLYTVRECFNFAAPDTSWMKNPPERENFIRWMPGGVLPQ